MPIQAPSLYKQELRTIADEFLTAHHSARTIPVPIDVIIERPPFSMDIVPVPGLQENFDTVAYITSDLLEIRVDTYVFRNRLNRYRFSLAHELSHKLLHEDIFRQLEFSTISEWKASRELISEREYGLIEWQANFLAGLILVPPEALSRAFLAAQEYLASIRMSIDDATPAVWDTIESWIAQKFEVSRDVIARRGPADNLWEVE